MELIVTLIACLITSIICNVIIYYRSVCGDMDISWNDEKQCWDANMHIAKDIDFSKKRKLIVKINHK